MTEQKPLTLSVSDIEKLIKDAYVQGYLAGKFEGESLSEMDTCNLKAIWDLECDENNFTSGFDIEGIHAELNRRGCGDYCSV